MQSLGASPVICAVIGNDREGDAFIKLMQDQGLAVDGLVRLDNRPTTVKTRVIGHNQQMLRIDAEKDEELAADDTKSLLNKIRTVIATHSIDAIIFEDYDKGVISRHLIAEVVAEAKSRGIITVVDPKKRNFLYYKGVTLFKPNLKELREGLKIDIDTSKKGDLEKAAETLQKKLECDLVMVTLSELGVFMLSESGQKIIPAHIRKIADVSGAGDTVIATAALCLAAGLDEFKTAAVANLAGGLVCEHVGVVSIDKERLLDESHKV
ncbi:bifunctional heptose 7-phosphate kinase/heptose 1-phosphate adenyltransferase [Arcticibacter sp. MXS-1]|uniref:bifunctional heptose 7-phosphate kinase/heptose 1-phosphate adenyltransferase n=1 Tax=Arcticibacter sp. MXS-1 TaxID=3341726 RepID=UPI0035A8DA25